MVTYKTTTTSCPNCGAHTNRASFAAGERPDKVGPDKPRAGDVGVCWNCAAVNVYVDSFGNLRKPNADECAVITADDGIQKIVRAIQDKNHASR